MAEAAKQDSFEGDVTFLKELGTVLSEKYVSFVLLNVACDCFEEKVTQRLRFYMQIEVDGAPDFKLAFNTIIRRHSGIYPLYEVMSLVYIPVRSEIDIDNYVKALSKDSLLPMINCDSLANNLQRFLHETHKTLLRAFYEFLNLRSDNNLINLNDVNNAIDVELIQQVFGHRGKSKFVNNHPKIFVYKRIKNECYISLPPNVDIERYIETLPVHKIKLHREEDKNTVDNIKPSALTKYEKEAILFLSKQIDTFSKNDRILTVKDYIKKVAPTMDSHVISELKLLYGCQPFRKFVAKHKTVFQPLNKLTGHKKEAFHLANDEIIQEYIRSSTEKDLNVVKKKRMDDIEKAIRIECASLNFVRSLIVAETDITVAKLRKEVVEGGKANNAVKNCLSKAKIDDFFFKHSNVFPMIVGKEGKMIFQTVSDQRFQEYFNHVKKSITEKMVSEIELQASRKKHVEEAACQEPGPVYGNKKDYQPDSDDDDFLDMIDKYCSMNIS